MKDAPAVAATIDQYIAGHAPAVQARLAAMRATIRQYAPAAAERISYGIPNVGDEVELEIEVEASVEAPAK